MNRQNRSQKGKCIVTFILENDNDDNVQEFDPTGILEEVDETNENEDADGESSMTNHLDMELDEFSTEIADNSEKNYDVFEKFSNISGVNEIDDNSAEPLEEVYIISIIFILFHL